MKKMVKLGFERLYDSLGTDRWTVDKDFTIEMLVTEERAEEYISHWEKMGYKCYETSAYRCWWVWVNCTELFKFKVYK